jgi:crossover junction endodeoxyribonuclease RuvC
VLALGIDPGTATTGWGLVEETAAGELLARAYGVILTPAATPMPERLADLYAQLQAILLLHRPDTAAVEKLFFARNVTTAISVGQGRGVVLLALAQAGLEIEEYTPMEIKQAVVGYGGAEKRQVQEMVRAILTLRDLPKPDDAADALAVALCHLQMRKMRRLTGG